MELNEMQQDVLQELVNIGMGRAAGALNQMTRSHIELSAPSIRLVRMASLERYGALSCRGDMDVVKLRFRGSFSGLAALLFETENGSNLVGLLLGERRIPPGMEGLRCDTLREVGNIVLIWLLGAIANAVGTHLDYSPLEYAQRFRELLHPEEGDQSMALLIKADFSIEGHVVRGDVLVLFDSAGYTQLLEAIDRMLGT